MSMKEEMQKIRAERESLSQKIHAMAGVVFAEEAKILFEAHPKLESFSWTQYTPYFNDGESCEFSAHTDYVFLNGDHDEEYDAWSINRSIERSFDWQDNPYTPTELDLAALDVVNFLKEFDNDDLLMMFGDHTSVTVFRDGRVENDHCDHD